MLQGVSKYGFHLVHTNFLLMRLPVEHLAGPKPAVYHHKESSYKSWDFYPISKNPFKAHLIFFLENRNCLKNWLWKCSGFTLWHCFHLLYFLFFLFFLSFFYAFCFFKFKKFFTKGDFLLFMASVRSRKPGPTLVPGEFHMLIYFIMLNSNILISLTQIWFRF